MTDLVDLTLTRALAKRLSSHFGDLSPIVIETERAVIAATLEQYQLAQVPIEDLDQDSMQPIVKELSQPIRNIGLRLRPDYTQDQARMWVTAQVDGLVHLPPRPAITAAKEAKREPLKHPSELQEAILRLAEPHIAKLRRAERQLQRMLRMKDQPHQLTASPEAKAEAQRLSHEELQTMPAHLRSIGIGAGWLHEDDDGVLHWSNDDEDDDSGASAP